MRKIFWIATLLIFAALPAFSQNVEMADAMRSEGKIYVVVFVLAIITIGLFAYLFFLDKKLSNKENSLNNK